MPAALIKTAGIRFALIAGVWVVLTGGSFAYWGLGLLVIGAATVTSLLTMPAGAWPWSPAGLARFVPYFAWQSLRGGYDVARRALHPRLPIHPGVVQYRLRLPDGPWRVFFVNALSLMPGTATLSLEADILEVHALDRTAQIANDIRKLEDHVADLFAIRL